MKHTTEPWVNKSQKEGETKTGDNTCERPDYYLANSRKCEGCVYYDFCKSYLKEGKEKPRRRGNNNRP